MATILKTLKKEYSDKTINLLFNTKVTIDVVKLTINKMLYTFNYNDFFNLEDKYYFNVDVTELNNDFIISITSDDDNKIFTLIDLEVIKVV